MTTLQHSSTPSRFVSATTVVLVTALALGAGAYALLPSDSTPQQQVPIAKGASSAEKGTGRLVSTTAKNLPTTWDLRKGTNVLWTAPLGKTSYGGPTFAGGRIFVGTNNERPRDPSKKGDLGVVMCFDQKTGKLLWQITHEKLESGNNDYPRQGVGSTPTVEGEFVYYVSNRAEVVCAHVDGDGKGGGKIAWTYDMVKEAGVYPCFLAIGSPLIVGDFAYVVTGNGIDADTHKVPKPDAASFLALNKKTGKVVWQSNLPGKNIMEGQWSNPVFANPGGTNPQVIFPGGDGWLYSFEPTKGTLLWKFFCNPKKSVWNPERERLSNRCYFLATPVVYKDKLYVGVGRDPDKGPGEGHFWCIDVSKKPTNKDKDLSPVNDNFDPKAAVNKDSALVWHFGGPVVPAPKEGGREYHFGRTMSTACLHEGLVYLAELNGYCHCLDAETGKKYWTHDLLTGFWASPYYADGKVYLGSEDGEMIVMQGGKQKKLIGKADVGYPCRTPVYADGDVVYVMTDGYLYALKTK